jgi:hypothetical protein
MMMLMNSMVMMMMMTLNYYDGDGVDGDLAF